MKKKLTDEYIKYAQKSLDDVIDEVKRGFVVPVSYQVLSDRYRGKGRPRKEDYNNMPFDWAKNLGTIVGGEFKPLVSNQ